jgi:hypothetical protein
MPKPKKIINDPKDAVDEFIAGLLFQFVRPLQYSSCMRLEYRSILPCSLYLSILTAESFEKVGES